MLAIFGGQVGAKLESRKIILFTALTLLISSNLIDARGLFHDDHHGDESILLSKEPTLLSNIIGTFVPGYKQGRDKFINNVNHILKPFDTKYNKQRQPKTTAAPNRPVKNPTEKPPEQPERPKEPVVKPDEPLRPAGGADGGSMPSAAVTPTLGPAPDEPLKMVEATDLTSSTQAPAVEDSADSGTLPARGEHHSKDLYRVPIKSTTTTTSKTKTKKKTMEAMTTETTAVPIEINPMKTSSTTTTTTTTSPTSLKTSSPLVGSETATDAPPGEQNLDEIRTNSIDTEDLGMGDESQGRSLENDLNKKGVKCGRVPIYEKLYRRSFNESQFVEGKDGGDFRILYGIDSVFGEWPWIVRIEECVRPDKCSTCTGTLLNSRWLITAGHCGYNRSTVDKYSATLGLYDLISPEGKSLTMSIDRIIVHPDYNDLTHDLTLMRLSKPVKFNDYIQPACLIHPTRNVLDFTKDKFMFTVGYGLTEGMVGAVKLQKLQIRSKQPSECNSDKLGSVQLRQGTMCIGPPEGQRGGSCKGDSGGPDLVYDRRANKWIIFGTVSYGPADCDRERDEKWLTVSVDLSNYRSWILDTIAEHS